MQSNHARQGLTDVPTILNAITKAIRTDEMEDGRMFVPPIDNRVRHGWEDWGNAI